MKKVSRYSVLTALTSAAVLSFLALTIAFSAKADTANLGAAADTMCNTQCAKQAQLAQQKKDPSLNCPTTGKTVIACSSNPAGGSVTGHCVLGMGCKADSATGSNGKSMSVGDLSSLLSGIASLMKALGGGAGGGSPPPSPTGATTQGCTQYYQVSTPSSDPCAYYVPPASSGINIDTGTNVNSNTNTADNSSGSNSISSLISSLLGGGSSDATGGATDNGSGATSTAGGIGNISGGVSSSTAQSTTGVGSSSATGDIRVLPNGATIVITNQNGQNNSVVAGFLGAQATGGIAPTGIAASWCRERPWASNFLSFIIPATFFDSLCALRGFQVGEAVEGAGPAQIGSQVTLIQTFPSAQNASGTAGYQSVPTSPPMQVDIWSVPAAVPLGGRTTIFWNSKNAASCTETSPDGSFSHSSLSGGGATVPLSGPTVFTISCIAADGTHATHDVMVTLTI